MTGVFMLLISSLFLFFQSFRCPPWDRQTDRSTFAQSIGEEAPARALVYSKLLHQIRLVHIFHRHMRTRQKKIYPFSIHYQMTASQHSEMKQPRPLCDIYKRERAKAINRLNWINEWEYILYLNLSLHIHTHRWYGCKSNKFNWF
jgi:hypothetical protein